MADSEVSQRWGRRAARHGADQNISTERIAAGAAGGCCCRSCCRSAMCAWLAEFADAPSHAALAAAAPTSPAEPPGSDPDGDHHGAPDLCAICATLALIHAGVAATPPALPLPALAGSADSCALPVPAHAALKAAAFQPRAPPTA
ncbi:MAG: hypothetical protein MZV49_14035 [Rhodopseudomonas palustris]|nr:hypothetical protein [Rhodopseudomonas palustris]